MRTLTYAQATRQTSEAKEYFNIGCTPHNEKCTQAGERLPDAIIECTALKNQLIRLYGQQPEGVEFFIMENFHDFGIYYDLNIFFIQSTEEDENHTESEQYAFRCECLPDNWDEYALIELRQSGHTQYQPAKVIRLKTA